MDSHAETTIQLPKLVFGSGSLGNMLVATPDAAKREVIRSWLAAMPAPIAIDSAGKYGAGLALEVIGRELDAANVDPRSVVISNKLGWRRAPLLGDEPTFEPGIWKGIEHDAVQDISGPGIRRCWEEGNELLGRYQTDLLSVHDPDEYLNAASDAREREKRFEDVLAAYEELAKIRDAEKLRGIGVGSKDWRTVEKLSLHIDFDWVMIANSLTLMSHPPELLEFLDSLAAKNTQVINSAVLHGGFLTGGTFCDYQPIDPSNPEHSQKLLWRNQLNEVCKEHGVNLFQAAVAFGLAHRSVSSIALSSSRADRTQLMNDAVNASLPKIFWQSLLDRKLIRDAPSITNQLI